MPDAAVGISSSEVLSKRTRIFVAGHRGMVGSSICRCLIGAGYAPPIVRTRAELDLLDQRAVSKFFADTPVDYVVLAAAKVGGIHANNRYPADFLFQNLMIEAHVIEAAFRSGVERLLFMGSSCIYPKHAPQPMREEDLLAGRLEPTNAPYAIAKIAGIKLCESYNRQHGTHYRAVMPTNLYGPNDNFDLENAHVLPALIRKYHLAKLAAGSDWEGIERDAAVFGPIPDDIRETLQAPQANDGDDAARRSRLFVCGAAAPRSGNFCTSTIWPRPALRSWACPTKLMSGCAGSNPGPRNRASAAHWRLIPQRRPTCRTSTSASEKT
jgi:GDP-L-fucose synthase